MTQSIFIQVGQCGTQIGYRFWDLALKELMKNKLTETDISGSFFRTTDDQYGANKKETSCNIKARALFIDMEKGTIGELLKGPLKAIFDHKQMLTDVAGSGNNWAVGYHVYGKAYRQKIEELIRKESEMCDSLQCFFLLHSMGGGTGSGLGTFILEMLSQDYPKKNRFVTSIYPSSCDDVVTSPYNALLANQQLIEYADCVFPVENKALVDMCDYISKQESSTKSTKTLSNDANLTTEKPFDQMNDIIAKLLLNITCSSRYPGSLNVDLNEIVINMMPFPRLHFLTSSMSPLVSLYQSAANLRMNNMMSDLFSHHHCLFEGELKKGTFMACALLVRGAVNYSDVQRNIERCRGGLRFVSWNEDGWKTGLCSVRPIDSPYSAVLLSNNSSVWQSFRALKSRFLKMYVKKAHLHHFLQVEGFESYSFDTCIANLDCLIQEYKTVASLKSTDIHIPRTQVLV